MWINCYLLRSNIVSVLNYRKPYGHKGLSDQGKVPLMSKIVVIGANHAGTAASNTILYLYKGNELTIIYQNSNISFLGCGMALWIGKQISGSDGLFYQTKEGFESKGAQVFMETRVDSIDYDAKKVHALGKMVVRSRKAMTSLS